MTTKGNPIQRIKLLVMVNSLLLLTMVFLAFFNEGLSQQLPLTANQQIAATAELPAIHTVASNQTANTTNEELKGLPYISRSGLAQQAAIQVVSVQQQPRVKARSSR